MTNKTDPTMTKAVDPVVAQVHAQQGKQPGPGAVPGQGVQAEPLVEPHVG